MTKHAIEGMTKSMAIELAESRIRVNAVGPTWVDTPMTRPALADPAFRQEIIGSIPMGHLAQIGDIIGAVVFLASPADRNCSPFATRILAWLEELQHHRASVLLHFQSCSTSPSAGVRSTNHKDVNCLSASIAAGDGLSTAGRYPEYFLITEELVGWRE